MAQVTQFSLIALTSRLYGSFIGKGEAPEPELVTNLGGDDAPRWRKRRKGRQQSYQKYYQAMARARVKEDDEKLSFNKAIAETLQDAYNELNGIEKVAAKEVVSPFIKKKNKRQKAGKKPIPFESINWRRLSQDRLATETLLLEYYRDEIVRKMAEIEDENTSIFLLLGDR